MKKKQAEAALEAILFTMGDAVELSRLSEAVGLSEEETAKILNGLNQTYEKAGRGIRIVMLDGAYQMCTSPDMYEYLIRVAKHPKKQVLTDVLLETLSIVAYKQPITRQEIEKIRGVSCAHAISKLVEYDLICELGRLDAPGRPLMFGTTQQFLRTFGVSSLEELPTLDEDRFAEFQKEAEEEIPLMAEDPYVPEGDHDLYIDY
jgi:segregation and condensation protein B